LPTRRGARGVEARAAAPARSERLRGERARDGARRRLAACASSTVSSQPAAGR
jgi:hypothetical protein